MKPSLIKKIMQEVGDEIDSVLKKIDDKKTEKFIRLIRKSKKVFLIGSGRSGLVAEAFGMRIMQLGLKSYILGESISPEPQKGDLLVVISGSGKTKVTKDIVFGVKKRGIKICLLTANLKSELAKESNLVLKIDAKTKLAKRKSIEPLGSLFEQASFVYLDSVIILLMKKLKKSELFLKKMHSKSK